MAFGQFLNPTQGGIYVPGVGFVPTTPMRGRQPMGAAAPAMVPPVAIPPAQALSPQNAPAVPLDSFVGEETIFTANPPMAQVMGGSPAVPLGSFLDQPLVSPGPMVPSVMPQIMPQVQAAPAPANAPASVPNKSAPPLKSVMPNAQEQPLAGGSGFGETVGSYLADPGVAGMLGGLGAALSPEGSIGRAVGTTAAQIGQSQAFANSMQNPEAIGTSLLPPELQVAAQKILAERQAQELEAQRTQASVAYQNAIAQKALAPDFQTVAPGSMGVRTDYQGNLLGDPMQIGTPQQKTAPRESFQDALGRTVYETSPGNFEPPMIGGQPQPTRPAQTGNESPGDILAMAQAYSNRFFPQTPASGQVVQNPDGTTSFMFNDATIPEQMKAVQMQYLQEMAAQGNPAAQQALAVLQATMGGGNGQQQPTVTGTAGAPQTQGQALDYDSLLQVGRGK